MSTSTQLHASCVSIDGKGVLLLGESGSGKSDLALRLIDGGAKLVADDRVDIFHTAHYVSISAAGKAHGEDWLIASAPGKLRGLLEVRGIGILEFPYSEDMPLTLAIKLVAREAVDRLPEPQFFDCLGLKVPLLSLHAFDHSTPIKIRLALAHL